MKLALYFTQHESLGHTTRVTAILDGLKSRFGEGIEILILHGGKEQDFAGLEKYGKVVNLPFSVGKEFYFRHRLLPALMGMQSESTAILKERLATMKAALKGFKPDVFVTEYFPFGKEVWHMEIPLILRYVRENFNSRIIASAGYPEFTEDTHELVERFYDAVLFHCTKLDIKSYLSALKGADLSTGKFTRFMETFSGRIHFTGYVIKGKKPLPAEKAKKALGIQAEDRLVVVHRGGGVVNPKLITSSLVAARAMPETRFLVSAGPATGKKEFMLYEKLAKKPENVTLVKYFPDFQDCLNAADLSVSLSGYNTCVLLMRLKKQGILVPLPRIEQLHRARMLEGLNLAELLSYGSLNGRTLGERIRARMDNPLKPLPAVDELPFNGAQQTAELIEKISGGGSACR
jgi:predicted glycosyltransferase